MFFRLSVVCFCFAAVLVVHTVSARTATDGSLTPTGREIKVVKDIREFAQKHPGLRLIRLEKQRAGKARNQQVRYTLGGRVSGDRLVAQSADVYAYPAKKDVTIQLTYPESGTGSIVTYVEIVCSQDSDDGNAYVVAGGVGQRFISIVVEANQTENFAYSTQIYGSD